MGTKHKSEPGTSAVSQGDEALNSLQCCRDGIPLQSNVTHKKVQADLLWACAFEVSKTVRYPFSTLMEMEYGEFLPG